MLPEHLMNVADGKSPKPLAPKRGEEIFEGVDYPRDWSGFVGQAEAIEQLQSAIRSAEHRKTRMDHTIIESGVQGVGKTTLATLTAYMARVGFMQTTGPLTAEQFRRLVKPMEDRDVLFIDEGHTLVGGNKNRADWLLPFMTEGVLYSEIGAEKMPDVTLFLATTEAGKIPRTLLDRFMTQPQITRYTRDQAALIVGNLADRMGVKLPADLRPDVAQAADHNPRIMRKVLSKYRDLAIGRRRVDMDKVFRWAGVTEDGLTRLACEMLTLLAHQKKHTMAIDNIGVILNEPGSLRHHEQILLQHGLIEISGRGRTLTDAGVLRAYAG